MISTEVVYLGDFAEGAKRRMASFGITNRFSTGIKGFDDYLGGGFGQTVGYEIVLLYGSTGIGKSLLSLNMIAPTIVRGTKIGLMVLEDDMEDVSVRLSHILGDKEYEKANKGRSVICMPVDALTRPWGLSDLLTLIENWYVEFGCELILLDHLQFAFENAEAVRGENEYVAQRVFMQKLNQLVKRLGKTIILVSHVGKSSSEGLDRIIGSSAIAQGATKAIEIQREEDRTKITLWKSRHTATPSFPYFARFRGTRLEADAA